MQKQCMILGPGTLYDCSVHPRQLISAHMRGGNQWGQGMGGLERVGLERVGLVVGPRLVLFWGCCMKNLK